MSQPTLPERFYSKVDKTSDGCWLWMGWKNPNGYGRFDVPGRPRPRKVYAHRFVWELERGPIPQGLQIDHLCRNRLCVNPDHLEVVDQRTNILRGESVSARNARKTHCKRGHALTPENVYRNPSSPDHRTCWTCQNDRNRARFSSRPAA